MIQKNGAQTTLNMKSVFFILLISFIFQENAWSIIKGQKAEIGQFPAALYLEDCTGTRIGPRHILTAAHCVYSKSRFEMNKEFLDNQKLDIFYGVDPESAEKFSYNISTTHVHPTYKEDLSDQNTFDLAIVVLEAEIDQRVLIAYFGSEIPKSEQAITLAGYGQTRFGQYERNMLDGNFPVNNLTEKVSKLHYGQAVIEDKSESFLQLSALDNDSAMLGRGDSGGAAYDPTDSSNLTIIGVNSAANIASEVSFIARIDSGTKSRIDLWIESLIK